MDASGMDAGGLAKHRVEALLDGICAVAMTLLVLDLKLPDDAVFSSDEALWTKLAALERHFTIYVITFVVIGLYWLGHHLQFHFVRATDRALIWMNLLYMLLVSFLPFATDLVGDHKDLVLPCEIYGLALLGLSALGYLHTRYLARHEELATASFTREVARMFEQRAAVFALVPLISMLVAFFDTHLALYVYVLLAAAHLLPHPIHDRIARGERQLVRSQDEASE